MTDDEIIAVVQAHKEGKKIEVCHGYSHSEWGMTTNPSWNFESMEYRVAPEPRKPREWWLINIGGTLHVSDVRQRWWKDPIHVREVIE